MSSQPARIVIVTPGMTGADGVSEVTRQFVDALLPLAACDGLLLEVWSLGDDDLPASIGGRRVRFRSAAGNRTTFASFGLRAGEVDASTLFVVMHVHLLPVMLPVIYRGARVAVLLLGIEAWKRFGRLTATALRQSWRVLAISSHTIAGFRHANPALADLPVLVCHPGVPTTEAVLTADAALKEGATATAAALKDCATPVERFSAADAPFALIVGRMSTEERYKGHDELIDIWPAVRAQVPDARLVVVGTGDDEARLRGRVEAAGLGSAIHFLGQVSAQQLTALYRQTYFFVMPSRREGFGLVFLEAMYAGRPCIAAPGAAEEIVTHGVNGLIVNPSERDDLIRAIVVLFEDPSLCARLGAGASATVAARFTRGHFVDRLYDALNLRTAPIAC